MTLLLNATFEAATTDQDPTAANGGPFSSLTTTHGTIKTRTTQAYGGSKSCEFAFNATGANLCGITPNLTTPSDYETIYHRFGLYIDTMANTSTVITLLFMSARFCVYLFNSTGWKIGFTPLHNTTQVKTGSEATSAAITTGAWHEITAIYKKLSASSVDFILVVDGVRTSTGTQTPSNFTLVSGANGYRIGSSQLIGFEASAGNGDKFFIDSLGIQAYPPLPAEDVSYRGVRTSILRTGLR